MKWIVDRFENDYAIIELEDGTLVNVLKCALPKDISEGDVIRLEIDKGETDEKREDMKKRLKNLFVD